MSRFAYSCVVDDDPVLIAQAFIWITCMRNRRSVEEKDIFVHITDIANTEFLDWLKSTDINIIEIEPFDQRSPHCNKIEQLRTFSNSTCDQIVCMDCDIAWVGDRVLPVGAFDRPRGEPARADSIGHLCRLGSWVAGVVSRVLWRGRGSGVVRQKQLQRRPLHNKAGFRSNARTQMA
jgi:hypothetical protein